MKYLLFIITISFIGNGINAQNYLKDYSSVREDALRNRFVTHDHVLLKISELKEHPDFNVRLEGSSLEGRAIHSISWGKGNIDILMWTQMHGDESTATLAMLDFLNYLADDSLGNEIKGKWMDHLTLHIIPMLNPDGAMNFSRRNALGIDLNRDAIRLQNPESFILKKVRDRTKAEYGLNLHDQSRYYKVGSTDKPATFSLLAPAYNHTKDVNDTRAKAIKLSSIINDYLQNYVPGQVGKYDDTYEPRAFGDNIQKWGTSVVLVECGGQYNDPEKQSIRKLHYGIFHLVCETIASGNIEKNKSESYHQIPYNNRSLHDLLIKNVQYHQYDRKFKIDIAFRHSERFLKDERAMQNLGYISDLGDLSTSAGYATIDASDCTIIWPKEISTSEYEQIESDADVWQLISQGKAIFLHENEDFRSFPMLIHQKKTANRLSLSRNPSFYLSCNDEFNYYIHNGIAYKLK